MNAKWQVARVSKRFGGHWALREASFSVQPGAIQGLIGPNGSGKTTLFRCIAGVMAADSGHLQVDGAPLTPADRKTQMYFVPDGIRPWPEQRVQWVLRYVAGLH